ncbi:MAG: EAL domain-containing protein [Spirochaetes bacterium]|nr:EAL domain-containing protein [Spirochaetota bacterium]
MMNKESSYKQAIHPGKGRSSRLLQLLVEPHDTITGISERRQARLVSRIFLFSSISILSGVIFMGFFSPTPLVGLILAVENIFFIISYILSRTRYHKQSITLFLTAVLIASFLYTACGLKYKPENLLLLTIWNVLGILICNVIAPFRYILVFVILNIIVLLLYPMFIPNVLFIDLTVPLMFNISVSFLTLIIVNHRNRLGKDRLTEISQINEQLKAELTERRRVEEMMAHSATHDALTHLPNRVLFMDRLERIMEYNKRHEDQKCAVLFLDLDKFKTVNDTLGHDAGDHLIIECANRMITNLRSEDTVARFGGDEFIILLEDIQDAAQVIHIADRIQADIARPFDLKGHKIHIFVSIGIVLINAEYKRAEDILRNADIAMYRSKEKGLGRYEIFSLEMLEHIMNQQERERGLRKALENKELVVYYQPIRDTKTDRIAGFEALIRWQHPEYGLIQPGEFISIAEDTGLIVPIGYWVIDEACRQIRIWQQEFHTDPPLTVSVNLSSRQCAQPDLVQKIDGILKTNEVNPASLKLELTESLIVKEPDSTYKMLSKLREMGIEVQIDDFGTGYSSLGYLHTLPIDTLKIDRIFINRLGDDGNGSDIVRTILALAHNLNMKVVAEGVETESQLAELIAMDCEYVQGFFFARPVDTKEAGMLLEKMFNKRKN